MQVEVNATIAASPDQIWPVLIDVERWHEWTPSIISIKRLENGRFGLGDTARIRQPKLPEMIWRVTDFQPQRGFVWEANSWGVLTVGEHWITPHPTGAELLLQIRQSGRFVPIFAPWISRLTRHYMELEAQGLKRRCEHATAVKSSTMSS